MDYKGGVSMRSLLKDKRGLATQTVIGILGLVFVVIISFVMIQQLTGADLLTTGSQETNATNRLVGNVSAGVDNVSSKIPTFFTIIAAVLIIGFVVLLWVQFRKSGLMSGAGGL